MKLREAIRLMGSTVKVSAQSDRSLAAEVSHRQLSLARATSGLPTKANVSTSRGLHGQFELRPISAMLELARGTALNEQDDIAAMGRRWSLLRYLGVFDRDPVTSMLTLHADSLRYIGANQRRVLSEDLGIGFAIVAAKRWCGARVDGVGPISVVDVDKILNNSSMPSLQLSAKRQPDYLLTYEDPKRPGQRRYELLETKGTVSTSTAKKQLGRAVTQLAGLTVNGRHMTGLAVSVVSSPEGILIMSVDPEEPAVLWGPMNEALERSRSFGRLGGVDAMQTDVDSERLFPVATNVELASLAEFSGQSAAATRWLPRGREHLPSRASRESRKESEFGQFVGSEFTVQLPGSDGARIRIYTGVEKQIADALRGSDVNAVLETQRAFSKRVDGSERALADTTPLEEISASVVSTDGAVLEISIA